MMRSRREEQFLSPDPEVIIKFVYVAHKIAGSLSIRKNSGACICAADIDSAPGSGNFVAVGFQGHSEIGGLARHDGDVLRGNFIAVIDDHHGVFSGAQLDTAASFPNAVAIHE